MLRYNIGQNEAVCLADRCVAVLRENDPLKFRLVTCRVTLRRWSHAETIQLPVKLKIRNNMLQLTQLTSDLKINYFNLVKVRESESSSSPDDIEKLKFTRALVAFYLKKCCECSDDVTKKHITDGYKDCGMDGLYYETKKKTLHIIQSKWIKDGNKGIEQGDALKVIEGVKKLLVPDLTNCNEEITALKTEIDLALNDANIKFKIVWITSSIHPVPKETEDYINNFIADQNSVDEYMSFNYMNLKALHAILKTGTAEPPINDDILLTNWTNIQKPLKSVSGGIVGNDLAVLFETHGKRIFAPNIRYFLGNTEVNSSIIESAKNDPTMFWYFHNGVTILVNKFTKKKIGGTSHETGVFQCEGLSIVNGAQTTGALFQAKNLGIDLGELRVPIRIIEVNDVSAEIARQITKNNNTQNRVDSRDFVSLDNNQERIAQELLLENVAYVFKPGDVIPDGCDGFTFDEAIIAQVLSKNSIDLMVQAKREISKLWIDTKKTPYIQLFNGSVVGPILWKRVQILRRLESWIKERTNTVDSSRDHLMLVHGNRFIQLIAYNRLNQQLQIDLNDFTDEKINGICEEVFIIVNNTVNRLFGGSQLATLFKNKSKCEQIYRDLTTTST